MKIKIRMNIIHWVKMKKRFGDVALFRVHWNFEKRGCDGSQHYDSMSCWEVEILGVSFIVFFRRMLTKRELRKGIKQYFTDREV